MNKTFKHNKLYSCYDNIIYEYPALDGTLLQGTRQAAKTEMINDGEYA